MKVKNIRLSPDVIPQHYDISLKPNLDTFTFEGEETIEIVLKKSTKNLTLHAHELIIPRVTVHVGARIFEAVKTSHDEKSETVALVFSKPLPKGKAKVKLTFTGILNDKMRGFYRSKYEVNGKTHYMASTQFEATDARKAFPCFDEPALKATFTVQLIIPKDLVAISNTLEEGEPQEHDGGYKVIRFAKSPKMSTYLLAFIVGRFEYIEKTTKEGIKVRVFVTPGKKKQAEFALDVAAKTISFFTDYFKIPYPLPVIDLIAIPDFAAGAMENWGAVTYRETALLVDEEHSATANKQWVALVIAHELAHQWFGNLVTMEWWTHLWLNEGFASYIEYLAVDKIFPDWNIWTQFVQMDHARALELDSLANTHPIEVEVHHPSEISEIFDAVSYSKGASVIRMIADYLGEDNFRKGLQQYLKKHEYSNASTVDLWKSLEKVSKKPVRKIMSHWTSKAGYPLVTVIQKKNKLHLTQSRYYSSPISKKKSKDTTKWAIPISVGAAQSKKPQQYLMEKATLDIPSVPSWVKLNVGESSFMRVAYTKELLQALHDPIQAKSLSAEDRFGIVRDAFNLVQTGELSTSEALELLPAYINEDNYIVWVEIISNLLIIGNLIGKESFYPQYKAFCQEVLRPIAHKVGWQKKAGETHTQTLLRSTVLYALGTSGDKNIIKEAQDLFAYTLKNKKLDSDLRGVVYSLVAENGGVTEYNTFMELYDKTPFQEEKDRILKALCRFKKKELLGKTLAFSLSEKVRAQDAFKVVSYIFGVIEGRDLAWNFVKENWNTIMERFSGGHLLPRFIKGASNFVTKEEAQDVENFFKKHKAEGTIRTIAQVIEQIQCNALWLSRDKKKIEEFLQNSIK